MLLDRYDPFRGIHSMQSALNRFFDDNALVDASRGTSWVPAVDVYEDPERLSFRFDVPGLKKEDVTVRVEHGLLTVEGKRVFENDKQKNNYHRIERSYGAFARSFSLPSTVAADKVEAEMKEGVLRINFPKKAEAQARNVEIR